MHFEIQTHDFNDYFRAFHSDVCHMPEYGYGDVTRIDGHYFWGTDKYRDAGLIAIWGLTFPASGIGYDSSRDTYRFKISDRETFDRCRIGGFGEIVD